MKNTLTPHQIAFLEAVGNDKILSKRFYLSGGTPLAVFYLGHRYSEDLDFFSEQEFSSDAIVVFLERTRNALRIASIDFQSSFNRNIFFLRYRDKTELKVEFTFYPFHRIEKGLVRYGVSVDSIFDIAVNKLFTIYQRTAARDYIDLYLMCKKKGFSISELIRKAKVKFDWHIDPIQLGTQFVRAQWAEDVPRMISRISETEWKDFFLSEAKKLQSEVFE